MKVILILVLYVQGLAEGQFTPAPAFETIEECKTFFEEHKAEVLVEGGNIRAVCVGEDTVLELQ